MPLLGARHSVAVMLFRTADLQVRSSSWCGPGGPRSGM